MRSYRYLHLDVFTDHLFGGNQLAVFLDGRGLSTETMQAIAKEMNFSETTFVLPADRRGPDVRMRIFTPGDELPVAGHPTIGSTFALARAGVIDRGRKSFVFGLGIGPTPVTLTWTGGELSFVWMAPELGVTEDPATGIASGPLGCYLVRHQIVRPEKAGAMVSLQGAKMGRPSYVHISIDADKSGKIGGVRVGGEAVLAGEGTLYV